MFKKVKSLLEIKMLKNAIALTGGRFFYLAVSIILLLIQSRYVGPEITGVCQAYAIPLGYLWILTMGVPSALQRELPYYLARGERDQAMRLAQTAQAFSLVLGVLCAGAFLLLSMRALVMGNYLAAAGWAFQIIGAFFTIYGSYVTTLFRTTDEFIKIAKSSTISAVTNIIVFPLIFFNPYLGIWTRSAASTLMSNGYLYIKRPFKLNFNFEMEIFKPLVRFGLPLIIIGYIEFSLWSSTQATLIVKMGNETYLGLFNFLNSILGALLIIPNAVADILRPRFAAVFGESDGKISTTLKVAVKPLILALAVSLLAIAMGWLLLDDIISWLLPKYAEAIPAIGIALLVVPVMTVHSIKYVFVVYKNMIHNMLATVPGFMVGIAGMYLLLARGMSFTYIFLPYLAGQTVNLLITLALLLAATRREIETTQ